MVFYLKPPQGVLPLLRLQTCVRERFQYLQALLKKEVHTPKNFEYLIEGTAMDRAGHFLLRLISLSTPEFQDFVLRAETVLFLQRLNSCNSSQEAQAFLKLLHRHTKECVPSLPPSLQTYKQFLLTAKYVCEKMMTKSVAAHWFESNHSITCTEFSITLPFTMCLPMVRDRTVDLHAGNAFIPCGQWKQLLAIFFQRHMQLGMHQLQATGCFENAKQDPRMKALMWELRSQFKFNKTNPVDGQLKACEVERESVFFPPCMSHLYTNLRSKHRLSHEARRQFTLFLKDAEMPLNESINFWSAEYSQTPSCGGCNRSWQKDSKRYIYSIRHMYGLEGGRYNYKVSNCKKIQGLNVTSMAEGGCPFTHFDNSRLKACLPTNLKQCDWACKKILLLKTYKKPQEACSLYLSLCKKSVQDLEKLQSANTDVSDGSIQNVEILNPIQYYSSMKIQRLGTE